MSGMIQTYDQNLSAANKLYVNLPFILHMVYSEADLSLLKKLNEILCLKHSPPKLLKQEYVKILKFTQ